MKKISPFILLLFIAIASVHAALITPAIPNIQDYFKISADKAQWVVVWFLMGYMLGQLIYSPFANKYGRRFALRLGLSLNIIALIFCILSYFIDSFAVLIFGRFLSALGSSAGLVCTFILINELYEKEEAHKVISYSVIYFTASAGLSVSIGGFLTVYLGWVSCFVFLLIYAAIMLFITKFIPETLERPDKEATKIKKIIGGYSEGFSSLNLILFTLILALSTTIIYAFSAAGPIISHDILHLSPDSYGLWNLLNALGMLLGGYFSGRLSKYISKNKLMIFSLSILCLTLAGLISYYYRGNTHVALFFIITSVMFLASSIVFANAASFASTAIPDKANASAVMNFVNLAIAVSLVFVMGILPYDHFAQFLIVIGVPLLVALVAVLPAFRTRTTSACT